MQINQGNEDLGVMSTDKKLLKKFRQLSQLNQHAVMRFVDFLIQEEQSEASDGSTIQVPEPIAAPENESVVAAIKRLSAVYPMLDKGKLLGETSHLMTQHIMHGRDKDEVILELETVFANFYHAYTKGEPD
ncbi:MAG: Crp/Fnr family transcriptional regulator [Gammaproteobacteria bacterium]|nr:Crp/Fnr family transcriptional regulator [Gammaproteobacteria bacterium]MDH5731986.1 Crp/Fnr family transcriptional regulator [Gammaproteobacteria bacterium]